MRTVNRGIFAIEKAGEDGKTVGMSFDQIILFSTIATVSFSIRSIPSCGQRSLAWPSVNRSLWGRSGYPHDTRPFHPPPLSPFIDDAL